MYDDVPTAAASGDHLAALRAILIKVCRKIDDGIPARDLPAMAKQVQDLLRKIDEIEHPVPSKPSARRSRWDEP